MTKEEIYLKAAKVIATCSPSRLPIVLETLNRGGFEFSEEDIKNAKVNFSSHKALKDRRKDKMQVVWQDSDDPCVLQMRDAYEKGLSLTVLSRATEISRPLLYYYLRGERRIPENRKEIISDALTELNF